MLAELPEPQRAAHPLAGMAAAMNNPMPDDTAAPVDAARPADYVAVLALVAEATRKSGLVWITLPGGQRAHPAWHHWFDDAAYVLAGGGEQPLRGLDETDRVAVTVRSKATGQRLVTWVAEVRAVPAGGEEWLRVVPGLHLGRLNAPDGRLAPDRWARESTLLRLTPTGELVEAPGGPSASGAAPPPPTPATTSGPLPFVLGRARSARLGRARSARAFREDPGR
ncbi:hypothetical protein [Solihabitans fulvus]|uniref:hypothetical protein n=1 Tax=Solihabitans fulvus TaxID=1892852 RepID=UPI001CB76131|nr:hypothetical protein [Solihabitans fulvus]